MQEGIGKGSVINEEFNCLISLLIYTGLAN